MGRTTFLRALALAAIFLGLPFYWWAFPPRLQIGTANGVYSSVCCGSISLHDGILTTEKGQEVTYVIEHDKVGSYVLPKGFVGTSNHSLIFNRDGNPLKLRLDGDPQPTQIEVINDASGEVIAFDRRKGS